MFHQDEAPTVFPSEHVTSQSGTGLVHSAPAHGYDDYVAFRKAGLLPKDIRCPVDDEGKFTNEVTEWAIGVDELVGQDVLKGGTDVMIKLLKGHGSLLAEQTIEHRYPCDWKTKEPILVR